MVDTAAAEFPARSPYYYLSRFERDEMRVPPRDAVVVVGSGPIRIGQGIEFDYSCVHAAWALRDAGRAAVVVNNNPETVSTDFDVSDVLVFEPPGADEVQAAYEATGASGVMLAFGGQTAINLAQALPERGVAIVGSDRRSLDMAEDREKFEAALARLGIARPQGRAAGSFRAARTIARELGFPVLVRPSYVLGGRGMEIVYNEAQLAAYVETAPPITPGAPLLVDKYVRGLEVEVDAVYDGDDILVPGIFEHIERAGIHSGDSISVYPPQTIDAPMQRRIVDVTRAIAHELGIARAHQHPVRHPCGRAVHHRSEPARQPHRTDHLKGDRRQSRRRRDARRARREARRSAVRHGIARRRAVRRRQSAGVFVREDARRRNDPRPGDEVDRRSVGHRRHVCGRAAQRIHRGRRAGAVRIARRPAPGASSSRFPTPTRTEAVDVIRRYAALGYALVATDGTHRLLRANGIAAERINKIAEGSPTVLDAIVSRSVDLVINAAGPREQNDGYRIRRAAAESSVAALTSLDTARALAEALGSQSGPPRSLQAYLSQNVAWLPQPRCG